MVSIFDVARYILERKGEMSAWKLQKLCYYAQAWHYTWTEKRLFCEDFQAWKNGPVCPKLFKAHKGKFIVTVEDIQGEPDDMTADEKESVDTVLNEYGDLEPYELREMTHEEAPWKDARGDLPKDASSNVVITVESMGVYYGERIYGQAD